MPPLSRPSPSRIAWATFLFALIFSLSIRLAVRKAYGPVAANDSLGYLALADMMRSHDFSGYTAWRTPGYPLLLNLAGCVPGRVALIQCALSSIGIGVLSLVLFQCSHRMGVSIGLAAFLSISLNLLFPDAYILTESVATFLFTLVVVAVAFSERIRGPRTTILFSVVLGCLAAVLVLTRPQYIAIIPVLAIAPVFRQEGMGFVRRVAFRSLPFLLAAMLPILALVAFNKVHTGKAILSSTLPFNLSQHTLPFIEAAGSSDPLHLVPEIVRLRDQYWQRAQDLDDNRAFIPRPGFDPASAYSTYYLHLSFVAIGKHPFLYLGSVAKAWSRFWRVSLLYDADYSRNPRLDKRVGKLWPLQKVAWLFVNSMFLLIFPFLLLNALKRRNIGAEEVIFLMILAVSVLQALVEYGDNSRYAIPVQPSVAFVVFQMLSNWEKSRQDEPAVILAQKA
ncbi:MAG: hypothetical protein IJS32_03630 [Kiritimatiellae bacterium]|nr:hypothetical protein [Kiritimatiellia bacterium]